MTVPRAIRRDRARDRARRFRSGETSGISAYTREDLVANCEERFGKRLASTSIGRILRSLGLSRQKTRPSHPNKDPAAQAAFKKSPGAAEKKSAHA